MPDAAAEELRAPRLSAPKSGDPPGAWQLDPADSGWQSMALSTFNSFQCGYRHRVTKQECEKGADAEFVRYSEAFPLEDLRTWLGKLPEALFWVEGVDPEILQTLEAFPLLVTARSAAAS